MEKYYMWKDSHRNVSELCLKQAVPSILLNDKFESLSSLFSISCCLQWVRYGQFLLSWVKLLHIWYDFLPIDQIYELERAFSNTSKNKHLIPHGTFHRNFSIWSFQTTGYIQIHFKREKEKKKSSNVPIASLFLQEIIFPSTDSITCARFNSEERTQ